MTVLATPIQSIPKIVAASRASFLTHRTQSLQFRKEQLRALHRMVAENCDELTQCIVKDLNRSSDFEMPTILRAVQEYIDNLETLTQDIVLAGVHQTDKSCVRLSPLGSVLIIGAWNFPIMLVLEPLAGAIAAGNTAVVKPSEVSVHSAKLLTSLLEQYMDPAVVSVVNGGAEETTALLNERFDHIFYTGGTAVGRIVMMAAAKNLTPVTLELGGKCPVIITRNTDISKAAQKIAGWKTLNCGQVCLSVDYVLCPKDLQEELIKHCIATWNHLFTADPLTCSTYPHIVTHRQHARLLKLIEVAKTQSTMVHGGKSNAEILSIEPTIFTNVSLKDELMKDEIFGPIMPIVTCETVDEAVNIINQGEHPLGLYVFSDNEHEVEQVLRETRSGGIIVNDIASHFLNHALPFGGVGHSGIGNYHGRFSVDTFSHKRAVMIRSQAHV